MGLVLWAGCVFASLMPGLVLGWETGVTLACFCAVLSAFVFLRVRWLAGSAFRAVWAANGLWWLREGQGEPVRARLRADSRVFPGALWLRWDSPSGPRQAVLLRRGIQAEAVRRLGVRLRLQGIDLPSAELSGRAGVYPHVSGGSAPTGSGQAQGSLRTRR